MADTKKITNTSNARQGINTGAGRVMLNPGETREVTLDDVQLARIRRLPFMDIDGERSSRRTMDQIQNDMARDNSGLQQQLDSAIAENLTLQNDLVAERTEKANLIEKTQLLANQIEAANSEKAALQETIDGLTEDKNQLDAQIGTLVAEREENTGLMRAFLTKDGSALAGKNLTGLQGKHKGRGSYSIVNADGEEIVEKLTAEQSDAFDAMTPTNQLVWIDAQLTPPKQAEQE